MQTSFDFSTPASAPTRTDLELDLLTDAARSFLRDLHVTFERERRQLLRDRPANLARRWPLATHRDPTTRAHTLHIANGKWQTMPPPSALVNRRIEITGPAEPKMIVGALNSGANVFMADLEDALSPTWMNVLMGHVALQAALRRKLEVTSETGKLYRLGQNLAALVVRPRGLHLLEPAFSVDAEPIAAALFDFGLYVFHGGSVGVSSGRGPYVYLPKLEAPEEARFWAAVFNWCEKRLELPTGSVRATVLVETLPAALAMEEIVYELRDSLVGLNAGRWDYLFSMIKSFAASAPNTPAGAIRFPDRHQLTMTCPFMRRYAERLVDVAHRRGAHAIGGMSAFIPSRKDAAANEKAFAQVQVDKDREAAQGFDGTWVAHPDLVAVARKSFDRVLGDRPEQKDRGKVTSSAPFSPQSLLPSPHEPPFDRQVGGPTIEGMKSALDISLRYVAHWLAGQGAVAINGLMEDAATAEISRTLLWHWRKTGAVLEPSGEIVSAELLRHWLSATSHEIQSPSIAGNHLQSAAALLLEWIEAETPPEFLTVPAMDRLRDRSTFDNKAGNYAQSFATEPL